MEKILKTTKINVHTHTTERGTKIRFMTDFPWESIKQEDSKATYF